MVVEIFDSTFAYQDEYLGVADQLVITPMTDRVTTAMMHALQLHMGSAVIGEAGIGKSTIVCDVARQMGQFLVTIRLSAFVSIETMQRMLKGVALSGIWGRFETSPCMEASFLSVFCEAISLVHLTLRELRSMCMWTDGREFALSRNCAFMLLLNSHGPKRPQLPAVLSTCFRPVCIYPMRGWTETLVQARLAANGFVHHQVLATRFLAFWEVVEPQLSRRWAAQFGCRHKLRIVAVAISYKEAQDPGNEMELLVAATKHVTLGCLDQDDMAIFITCLAEVCKWEPPKSERGTAQSAAALQRRQSTAMAPSDEQKVLKVIAARGLQTDGSWLARLVQLKKTLKNNPSVILLGPSNSGKTTLVTVLAAAMDDVPVIHHVFTQSASSPEIFGHYLNSKHAWADGMLSALLRKGLANQSMRSWYLLDGPMEASWVDELDQFLDSEGLILGGEERNNFRCTDSTSIIFETDSLQHATPSTVARSTVVFVAADDLPFRSYLQNWLHRSDPSLHSELQWCCETMIEVVIEYIESHCMPRCAMSKIHMASSICAIIDCLLQKWADAISANQREQLEGELLNKAIIQRIASFAISWGVGVVLKHEDRAKLDHTVRSLSHYMPELGHHDSLLDFHLADETCRWVRWPAPQAAYDAMDLTGNDSAARMVFESMATGESYVPTKETLSIVHLLSCLSVKAVPTLLFGPAGSGKSALVTMFQNSAREDGWLGTEMANKQIVLSHRSTCATLSRQIRSCIRKRQGRAFGPQEGKMCILFVDDVHLPVKGGQSGQSTDEFLRQLLELGMQHDPTQAGSWQKLLDIWYILAAQPTVSQQMLAPRLLGRVFPIYVPALTASDIELIFGTLVYMRGMHAAAFDGRAQAGIPSTLPGLTESSQDGESPPAAVVAAIREQADILRQCSRLLGKVMAKLFHAVQDLQQTVTVSSSILTGHDMTKIFNGIVLGMPGVQDRPFVLYDLWWHECKAVLADKLDSEQFKSVVATVDEIATSSFPESFLCAPLLLAPGLAMNHGNPQLHRDAGRFSRRPHSHA